MCLMQTLRAVTVIGLFFFTAVACKTRNSASEARSVDDIASMQAVAPGKFAVVCKYHGPNDPPELRTSQQILANNVCNASGGTGGSGDGVAMACSLENGSFQVIYNGQTYQSTVNQFPASKVACGKKLATAYDGTNLVIFNSQTTAFDLRPTDANVANAKLMVNDTSVLFQGKADAIGFDLATGQLARQDLIAVAGFTPVWNNTETSAILYDGDRIYSYCGGKWTASNAANKTPFVSVTTAAGKRAIVISDYVYTLTLASCAFTREVTAQRSEPQGTPPPCSGSDHNGSWAQGGSCSHNGCWPQGGGCDHNGCWRQGGGCDHNGCWFAGGGCTHNGCWEAGGGCDHNGCWRQGSEQRIASFPADRRTFVCRAD